MVVCLGRLSRRTGEKKVKSAFRKKETRSGREIRIDKGVQTRKINCANLMKRGQVSVFLDLDHVLLL